MEALKIFFASKTVRKALWEQKTATAPQILQESHNPKKSDRKLPEARRIVEQHLNREWYTKRNGLNSVKAAFEDYFDRGRDQCLAPAPEFADDRGHLEPWGLEYFARLGLPLGQKPKDGMKPDDADALRAFSIRNPSRKPLAVVSANFGGYDRLLPLHPAWAEKTDFYLFTDRKFHDPGLWQMVHANYYHIDPRRRARFIKTHLPTYFSEYENVLWVDGNILVCRDPTHVIEAYGMLDCAFATFKHWYRSTLTGEAAACVQLGKEVPDVVGAHLRAVAGHAAFECVDIFATMVMYLKPNDECTREMCARWWRYILRGSKRDQLSLPLAVHDATGLTWRYFPETRIEMSPYFVRVSH